MARKKIRLQSDNLVQGVSQQVETKRTLNHATERFNIVPSVVHGNTKRPAAKVTSRLNENVAVNHAEHYYKRDETESYLITASDTGVTAFNRNTKEVTTVNAPQGYGYLASATNPSEDLCFLTLGDYTFICNKNVTTAMLPDVTPAVPHQAILYVTQGDYGTTYTVSVDGYADATVTTSDTLLAQTSTDWIVQQLRSQLVTILGADFTIVGDNSVLHIKRVDGEDFSMTGEDSINNEAIKVTKDSIQRFEDLPPRAPDGYHVKVTQSVVRTEDDYYVVFNADDPSNIASEGVWSETIATDLTYALDASTMPHALVREADGTFTFQEHTWVDRKAGDATSVPEASFIGRTISWLYFYQNRLGFLSGANKIESRTRDYFNFWRKSARTSVDSDPVDLASTTSEALELKYAIPFDQNLVVFADDVQLICSGGQTYSPSTAAMDIASRYEMDTRTAPVAVGRSLFFTVRQGRFTAVMEMQGVETATDRLIAVEVTEHVPQYIPEGRWKLVASAKTNTLLLISPDEDNTFAYNWMWSDKGRVVASWHKYTFGDNHNVFAGYYLENELELVAMYGDTPCALSVVFDEDGVWHGTVDDAHLDFVCEGALTETSGVTRAEFTLPYQVEGIDDTTGRIKDSVVILGVRSDGTIVDLTDDKLILTEVVSPIGFSYGAPQCYTLVEGSWDRIIIGEKFEASHTFSRPYPVRYGPRGEMIADLTNRLQLTKLILNVNDTGYFWVTVEKPNRATRDVVFSGVNIGNEPTKVDGVPLYSGSFKVPLRGQTQEITMTLHSYTWMPLCITSGEWFGTVIRKL